MLLSLHFYAACVDTINSVPAELNIKMNSMSNCQMNIFPMILSTISLHTSLTLIRIAENMGNGLTLREQPFSLFL